MTPVECGRGSPLPHSPAAQTLLRSPFSMGTGSSMSLHKTSVAVGAACLVSAGLLLLTSCGGGAADVVNSAGGSTGSGSSGSTGSGSGTGSGGLGGSGNKATPTVRTDVVTYKNDVGRTGQNLTESL